MPEELNVGPQKLYQDLQMLPTSDGFDVFVSADIPSRLDLVGRIIVQMQDRTSMAASIPTAQADYEESGLHCISKTELVSIVANCVLGGRPDLGNKPTMKQVLPSHQ
jgi:hypothetical protein